MIEWSEDVPKTSGISYSNEIEISRFLVNQSSFGHKKHLSIFNVPKGVGVENITLHSVGLLESFIQHRIKVEWFDMPTYSDYQFLGNQLRAKLLTELAFSSGFTLSRSEQKLLTLELGSNAPYDYYQHNILPLLNALGKISLIFFVDLRRVASQTEHNILIEFCSYISEFSGQADVRPILISHENSALTKNYSYRFSLPESNNADFYSDEVVKVLKGKEKQLDISPEKKKILSSLLLLDRPALSEAVELISSYSGAADKDISELISSGLLLRLNHKGVSLSSFGSSLQPSFKLNMPTPAMQAIKLIDLIAPTQSACAAIDFTQFEKQLSTQKEILELIACGIYADGSASSRSLEAALSATETSADSLNWLLTSGYTNTIIQYLGHMIIAFSHSHVQYLFDLLERITYSYSNFSHQQIRHGGSSNRFEPSRLLSHLAYVYNHSGLSKTENKRSIFFSHSARLLDFDVSCSLEDQAKIYYWKGWQLFDAGDVTSAANEFKVGAARLFDNLGNDFSDIELRDIIIELSFLSVAIGGSIPGKVYEYCKEYLYSLGPEHAYESLSVIHDARTISKFIYKSTYVDGPKASVICCSFDFHVGLLVAGSIYKNHGCITELIVISKNISKNEVQDLFNRAANGEKDLAIIIGAPDTPCHIGTAICEADRTIEKIYQIKLSDNFSSFKINFTGKKHLYLISGCGIAQNAKSWQRIAGTVDQALRNIEGSCMLEIAGSFLLAFVNKAGDKIAEAFVDNLAKLIVEKTGKSSENQEDRIADEILTNKHSKVKDLTLGNAAKSALIGMDDEVSVAKVLNSTFLASSKVKDLSELIQYIDVYIYSASAINEKLSQSKKSAFIMEAQKHYESFLNLKSEVDIIGLEDPSSPEYQQGINKANVRLQHRIGIYHDMIKKLE